MHCLFLFTLSFPLSCLAGPRGGAHAAMRFKNLRQCNWNGKNGADSNLSGDKPSECVECIFPNYEKYLASQNEYEENDGRSTPGPHLGDPLILLCASLSSVQEIALNPGHVLEGSLCTGSSMDGLSGLCRLWEASFVLVTERRDRQGSKR